MALVGPTGSGKSAIAIGLAKALAQGGQPAEIISADAMQLYRGMDIGTAKIGPEEAENIAHHLLDVWSPGQEASVQDYQHRARKAITDCFSRAVVPVVVGGSGLYVSSVLYQFDFPGTDETLRKTLEVELEASGLEAMAQKLVQLDSEASENVDLKNPRRVIRALEIIQLTGRAQTPRLHARGALWHEPTLVVGIDLPREELVRRIDTRVEEMWEKGLVDEVRRLRAAPAGLGKTASQAIGYREVLDFLDGSISEAEAKKEIAQHTKRYARKQMSWFRRDENIHWINPTTTSPVDTIIRALQALQAPGLSLAD